MVACRGAGAWVRGRADLARASPRSRTVLCGARARVRTRGSRTGTGRTSTAPRRAAAARAFSSERRRRRRTARRRLVQRRLRRDVRGAGARQRRAGPAGDAGDGGRHRGAEVGRARPSCCTAAKEVALALAGSPAHVREPAPASVSALKREMESFIAESGKEMGLPEGRFPSEAMLLSNDRNDLAQGVRWHGGFVRVARRMGKLNYAASAMADAEDAARALRVFAEARVRESATEKNASSSSDATSEGRASFARRHRHARLLGAPVMPTEAQLVDAGRHVAVALRIHDRRGSRAAPAWRTPTARIGDEDVAEDAPWVRRGARVHAQRRAAAARSARRFRDWPRTANGRGSSRRTPRSTTRSAARG